MAFADKIYNILNKLNLGSKHKKQLLQHAVDRNTQDHQIEQSKSLATRILAHSTLEDGEIVKNVDGSPRYLGKYSLERKYLDVSGYESWFVANSSDENFFIEIIALDLLKDQGFLDVVQWQKYLLRLESHNLVEIAEFYTTTDNRCVAVYKIPESFLTLDEIQYADEDRFDGYETVRLIRQVNEAYAITSRIGTRDDEEVLFSFVTVNPHTVIMNSTGDIKFLAVGSSLVSRPQYFPSQKHSKKVYPQSLGFGAYNYFLGLLTFELLAKTCPIKKLEAFKQKNNVEEDRYLSNSPELDQFPQHFRAFLKRSTHKITGFRYGSAQRIHKDLKHIETYLAYRESHSLDSDTSTLIELVDYIRLRLFAHAMNPSMRNTTKLPDKSAWLVQAVYKDLEHFFKQPDGLDRLFCRLSEDINDSNLPIWFDWIGPNGQIIYRHYQIWQKILNRWHSRPDAGNEMDVDFVGFALLMMIIDEEVWSYTQCLVRYKYQVATINLSIPNIEPSYNMKFLPRESDDDALDISFARKSVIRVNSLLTYLHELQEESNYSEVINCYQKLQDYSDLAFVSMALTNSITISDHHGAIVYEQEPDDEDEARSFYELGKVMLELHKSVRDFYGVVDNKGFFDDEINIVFWENHIGDLLSSIQQVTVADRQVAHLFPFKFRDRYITTNNKGIVDLISQPLRLEISAADFIRESNLQVNLVERLPAKVDILPDECNLRIGSLLITPFGYLPPLPQCEVNSSDLDQNTLDNYHLQIRDLLLPHCITVDERITLILSSLGTEYLPKFEFEGDANTFVVKLIYKLGELNQNLDDNPFVALLLHIRENKVGLDVQKEIDQIIYQL